MRQSEKYLISKQYLPLSNQKFEVSAMPHTEIRFPSNQNSGFWSSLRWACGAFEGCFSSRGCISQTRLSLCLSPSAHKLERALSRRRAASAFFILTSVRARVRPASIAAKRRKKRRGAAFLHFAPRQNANANVHIYKCECYKTEELLCVFALIHCARGAHGMRALIQQLQRKIFSILRGQVIDETNLL